MTTGVPFSAAERVVEFTHRGPTPITADSLHGVPVPARDWHTDGMVPGRTVTQLGGDGGVGKSTLALQLCVASALGYRWVGQMPRRGRSLYISAEDDRDELHRRVDQIALAYSRGLDSLGDVMLWPMADEDALLATGSPGQSLQLTAFWHDLEGRVGSWRPSLIVLDSLADFYGGNENDRGQVRQFIRLLRRLAIKADAAVVLLAHPSLQGLASGSGTSGSTAWNNSVRSRLYLSRPKDEDGGASASDVRTLQVKKANYAASGSEIRLRLRGGAFELDDATTSGMLDRVAADNRIDQQFLELLNAFEAQGRTVSHSTGAAYAPALFAKDPAARGTTSKGFEASMNRLFNAGTIRVAQKGPASRRLNFIERVAS